MKSTSVRARRGRLAVLALLAVRDLPWEQCVLGQRGHTVDPQHGHRRTRRTRGGWLSFAIGGEDGDHTAKRMRISMLVQHDPADAVDELLTDETGTATPTWTRSRAVTGLQMPTVVGGYGCRASVLTYHQHQRRGIGASSAQTRT